MLPKDIKSVKKVHWDVTHTDVVGDDVWIYMSKGGIYLSLFTDGRTTHHFSSILIPGRLHTTSFSTAVDST